VDNEKIRCIIAMIGFARLSLGDGDGSGKKNNFYFLYIHG
jgi:hypothetical protein